MIDEWSGFADLLANLIAKYAEVIDLDTLSLPPEAALELKENQSDEEEGIEYCEAA